MMRVAYTSGMEIHSGVIYVFEIADVPHYVLDDKTSLLVSRHEDLAGAQAAVAKGQHVVSIQDYQAR